MPERRKHSRKLLPAFASEAEEHVFWETHDSADHVDWSKVQRDVLPNLKLTTNIISPRFPHHLLDASMAAAKKREMLSQPLTRIWLQERIEY